MKRLRPLLVGLVTVAAACGGDDAGGLTTEPATAVTTRTTETPTTASPVMTGSVEGLTVQVFEADASGCSEDLPVTGVAHTIDESADPIRAAFELLLASPIGERDTTGMLRSVELADGLLTVDFDDLRSVVPNLSTTCGSFYLMALLHATAFQFPEVERVTYQIEGNCDTFQGWLQRGDCQEYRRP